jgi:hypothetical protein
LTYFFIEQRFGTGFKDTRGWGGCYGQAKESYRENQGKTQENQCQSVHAQEDNGGQKNQANRQKDNEEGSA